MKRTLKKSDFVLSPYMKSHNLKATYQVINTLIPYCILWFLAFKVVDISFLLLLPIIILIVLFSLRSFSLMHDCGHYSLFSSKKVNRFVGFLFGLVNAMPQYWWSKDHSYHHKTNGDWEKYRGIGDFLSTDEYDQLTSSEQKLYGILRHPLIIFPGGFFYLAFKPRLILIMGIFDFLTHVFSCLRKNPLMSISKIIYTHNSRYWNTVAEFYDVLLNSICVISGWFIGYHFFGSIFFVIYSIVLTLSSAIFISIFFVQHNFEGAYAHKTEDWDYLLGAVEGSSFLEMPSILKWFTADISYHSIHHLSERIPNYNLKACHQENSHLLSKLSTIAIADIPNCSKLILWDSISDQLVSIASHQKKLQQYSNASSVN